MNKKLKYILTLILLVTGSAAMAQSAHVTVNGDVFGGGNLADVAGKSTVTIDQANAVIGVVDNGGALVSGGNVYGGGALANVGTSAADSTTVNILDGIIHGNVYGGGLGDSTATGYNGSQNVAALVHGKVYVNIGAAPTGSATEPSGNAIIDGNVFGCNNINGTPLDSVFVNIYKTHHDGDEYPTAPQGGWTSTLLETNYLTQEYALTAVYGGGNKASYKPSVAGRATTVHVYYCSENTIEIAYGGGNAANVGTSSKSANTRLIIDGGIYNHVFGGGNGYSSTGNHNDPSAANYNPGANIFGTATTEIHAGLFKQVFGGSNQYGNITTVDLNIAQDPGCDEMILESFCGGNEADMVGADINATINCSDMKIGALYGGSNNANILKDGDQGGNVTLTVLGGEYDYVFGGSKGTTLNAANIAGDVTLNIHGGTIGSAFGGSDVNGNILGSITVNVLDTVQNCRLQLDTVYGGGRDAAYTPSNASIISPTVNIQHCEVDCVFGGGKGSSATVTANPRVVIGETSTINDPHGTAINTLATVNGDVYGGGDAANVVGTTTVLVQKCNSVVNYVYGGGNAAHVGGTQVFIRGGAIDTIFGGGHGDNDPGHLVAANVTGNDTIAITGGTVGKAFAGSNLNGTISGRMSLNVAKSNPATCDLMVGEVYGGSNQANGKAGTVTIGCTGSIVDGVNGHVAHPENIGTTLEGVGTVYGGANEANITGNIVLNIENGIINNVYGGNNTSGSISGTIQVNIDSIGDCSTNWYLGNVFGGGNRAPYSGIPDVNIVNGTVSGSVYGGGNMAGVSGGDVAMTGGTVLTGLYGGCNTSGTVTGDIAVSVTGGTIGANGSGANVHGGGYGDQTATGGDVDVTINGATVVIWGDVYGGSALGNVNNASSNETNVTLTSGTIHGDLYGGGLGNNDHAAAVNGAVQVTVNGGTVTGSVYGCNNANGAPQSTVNVDIYGTDTPLSGYALGHVFGGGNQAAYSGTPVVKVHNCTNSIEYVYGGGNAAAVAGTDVTIYGGNTIDNVFGGCYGANVTTSGTNVKIYGGTIGHVYGGNNQSGTITGSIAVNVNKQADTDPNGSGTACEMHVTEVYGGGNVAASNAGTITIGCTGTGVTEGIDYVYGGANQANVTGPINLTIQEGRIANVFGGNNTSGTITGNITVNIEKKASPCVWDIGNVFGGGNQATYSSAGNYPVVNILNGTVSGDVFGGGLGSIGTAGQVTGNPQVTVNGANAAVSGGVYGGGSLAPTVGNPVVTLTNGSLTNVFGGGKAANITGAPTVTINGGTVSTGVYGGCDSQGNVSGNIIVNVNNGTIGATITGPSYTTTDVFGGGYGSSTSTSGNVEVNITGGTIYGDVYGGSAKGNVNASGSNTTTVNVTGGTIETTTSDGTTANGQHYYVYHGGNVYGGGLGEKVGVNGGTSNIAALVNGTVTVNIGSGNIATTGQYVGYTTGDNTGSATIKGNVYGCNNTNGSPQENVTVNIFSTAHPTGTGINESGYALANVFGGGNAADFTVVGKTATVNIYGCDNTIERTFGGGNAAATNAVSTMIQGGRIHEAYAGGNGEVSAANVNGNVTLAIHGGSIGQSFAGSNQNGTISGTSSVTVDSNGGCGDVIIEEFFCGGNFADFVGNIDATIECSGGMNVRNLYGGCKQANVVPKGTLGQPGYEPGNVTLTVKGGNFENVFGGSQGTPSTGADIAGNVTLNIYGGTISNAIYGGSHINGSIGGTIIVNVEEKTGAEFCDLDVSLADVYGGGNEADYTAPGVTPGNYPEVNIKNATVKNVFGGGLKADVTGNPQIRIKKGSRVMENVYGGGNMGVVTGDPKVIINGKWE